MPLFMYEGEIDGETEALYFRTEARSFPKAEAMAESYLDEDSLNLVEKVREPENFNESNLEELESGEGFEVYRLDYNSDEDSIFEPGVIPDTDNGFTVPIKIPNKQQGGDNNMTEYDNPAELVVAAEEGEVTFEQYQAEVNAQDDLSNEEASYLGMVGAQLYLRDEVENLEDATEVMLETKYITDELIDDTVEELEGWREVYTEHMNEAAASMINSTGYLERGKENIEEAKENLEGKNEEMRETLEDSPLDDLRDLETEVNSALTSDETVEE
jgi:hypothetical protein